jgi:hypothetical protein
MARRRRPTRAAAGRGRHHVYASCSPSLIPSSVLSTICSRSAPRETLDQFFQRSTESLSPTVGLCCHGISHHQASAYLVTAHHEHGRSYPRAYVQSIYNPTPARVYLYVDYPISAGHDQRRLEHFFSRCPCLQELDITDFTVDAMACFFSALIPAKVPMLKTEDSSHMVPSQIPISASNLMTLCFVGINFSLSFPPNLRHMSPMSSSL